MNYRTAIAVISMTYLLAFPPIEQRCEAQVDNNSEAHAPESEHRHNTDEDLIRETLTDYIQGSTNGQPDRLRKAFHPDLNLYSIKNGRVSVWSGTDYIKDTKEGRPTGEVGKILSIDFENNAAIAKVEISNPNEPNAYIDYFMLLKAEGKWTIIHKMFTKKTGSDPNGNSPTTTDKKSSSKKTFKP